MSLEESRGVFERYRKFIGSVVAAGDDVEAARKMAIGLTEGFPIPADARWESGDLGGVSGEWVRTDAARDDTVALVLHGGGYVIGCVEAYRPFAADLGRNLRASVFSVDYALAPERPFPAAIEDSLSVYRALLDRGVEPGRIIIVGDSAGGGLAVALLLSIRDAGLQQPAAAWLLSPLVDAEMEGETHISKAHVDPLTQPLTPPIVKMSLEAYLQGTSPRHSLVSPIHADLSGLAPMRIDVGTHETLLDDSIKLARAAAIHDVRTDLSIWPGMVHSFPFFAPVVEEGREAFAEASAFLNRYIQK